MDFKRKSRRRRKNIKKKFCHLIAQAKKTNDYTEWLQYNWKMKHFIKKKIIAEKNEKKIK